MPNHTPSDNRSLTDFDTINPELVPLIEYLELTPEQVEKLNVLDRRDWTPGEPCPDCGSKIHFEYSLTTEILRALPDSTYQFETGGEPLHILAHQCEDCQAYLSRHPLFGLYDQVY